MPINNFFDFAGKIITESWGGKRRIDKILINNETKARIAGFAFSTALAGLTDHIPVSLSLKVETTETRHQLQGARERVKLKSKDCQ